MSTLKVDNIRHNNATSDAITMAADGTCTGNITNKPNYNLLINGQFDVWQRATSSNSTTGSGYVSADRWRFEASGATYNTSQQVFAPGQTDVPSNPKYYLRFNVTTANDNTAVTQRIEDVDSVQGQHTLSFWAKGTNPAGGSIQVVFLQDFGSGGSADVGGVIGTFSLSSSWAKQTFTFTPPSISGKTIGTSSYFNIRIRQPSADDTTTAWNIDLANVKLEAGSKATDYQRVGFGDELRRCLRYYEQSYRYGDVVGSTNNNNGNIDQCISSNQHGTAVYHLRFFEEKRANPTVTFYRADTGTSGQWIAGRSGNNGFNVVVTVDSFSTKSCRTYVSVGVAYVACFIQGHYTAEAEL